MVNLWNTGAFFVLFRESIEAAIVIGILLNFLSKTLAHDPELQKKLKKQVWLGALAGLAISIVLGIILTVVYYVLQHNVFSGAAEMLWEGCFQAVASIMLTWMAFGMLGAEEWYMKWQKKLHTTVNAPDFKWNKPWGFFLLTFTVVIREGLESVIFLTGVSGGDPISLIIPGVLGLLCGFFLGWLIFRGASTINVTRFLVISSIFLFFIAAGLLTNAAHEFESYAYGRSYDAAIIVQDQTLPPPITPAESSPNLPRMIRRSMDDSVVEVNPEDTITLPLTDDSPPIVAWTPPKRRTESNQYCPKGYNPCVVKTYYLGAHEQVWNYAPSGYDHFNGMPFVRVPEGPGAFTLQSSDRIGASYQKALFWEFTDETFSTRKQKPVWGEFLGPTIRTEVGQVVEIVFKNMASYNFSVHPHGVTYTSSNEGAPAEWLSVGTYVEPNNTYTYYWTVNEEAGPGINDGNAMLWPYHSHVHEATDVYAGLVGGIIVYKPGFLDNQDKATDVDKEFIAYFTVSNENLSPYISRNVNQFSPNADTSTAGFIESNMMHGVNGRMYNNLDGFEMLKGETVRWFTFAMGNEIDLHTIHWHGNTLLFHQSRTDVVALFPASYATLVMKAENPGTWLLHCHVADHMASGMISSFQIKSNVSEHDNSWTVPMASMEYVEPPPTSSKVLWDVSACCSQYHNVFFQVLNTLFGWQAVATVITTSVYFGYWLVVICVYLLLRFVKRRKQGVLKDGEAEASSSTTDDRQILEEGVANGVLPEEAGVLLDKDEEASKVVVQVQ